MEKLINKIKQIYNSGNLTYLLANYIDREFWVNELSSIFIDKHMENATDFNYNKCFTMYVNLSDTNTTLGSKSFENYIISNGNLFRIEIQISTLLPYVMLKYMRYYTEGDKVKLEAKSTPFLDAHNQLDEKIKKFFDNKNHIILNDDILKEEVAEVNLELRKEKVSVYNCLFEDSGSYFPY